MWRHLVTAALSLSLFAGMAARPPAPVPVRLDWPAPRLPRVLRFRVIANSDSLWDESVKIAVRNLVLQTLAAPLARARSPQQAEALIRLRLPELAAAVDQLLRSDGAPYLARVTLGRTAFPTKAYGTWVLPAGRYPALIVRLGRGDGHNWWCVLFPTLCFIDMGSGLAVPVGTGPSHASEPPAPGWHVVWWIPFQHWLSGL